MGNLFSAKDAREMTGATQKRRESIAALQSAEIKSQCNKGLQVATFIPGLIEPELQWLKDELSIQGYKINGGLISW